MLNVKTTWFGEINIDGKRVIQFPEGLLGFSEQKNYVILEHKPGSPLLWLQSTTAPYLAFVITDPFPVKKDYLKDLQDVEKRIFKGMEDGRVIVLVIVTIKQDNINPVTMNLMGPLVIDAKTQIGRQVILEKSGYSHRHPLIFSH